MSTIATTPVQIIEGQNLDPRKLLGLLSDVYGQDKFKVEVSLLLGPKARDPTNCSIDKIAEAESLQDLSFRGHS